MRQEGSCGWRVAQNPMTDRGGAARSRSRRIHTDVAARGVEKATEQRPAWGGKERQSEVSVVPDVTRSRAAEDRNRGSKPPKVRDLPKAAGFGRPQRRKEPEPEPPTHCLPCRRSPASSSSLLLPPLPPPPPPPKPSEESTTTRRKNVASAFRGGGTNGMNWVKGRRPFVGANTAPRTLR
jgi:hypothetical protein